LFETYWEKSLSGSSESDISQLSSLFRNFVFFEDLSSAVKVFPPPFTREIGYLIRNSKGENIKKEFLDKGSRGLIFISLYNFSS